jgi:hypothetical protein
MRKSFARSIPRCRRLVNPQPWRVVTALLVATVVSPVRAASQVVPGEGSSIGSLGADRARVRQITGRAADTLVNTDSLPRISPLYPTLRLVSNSALPSGGNDGALWAGRGVSGSITGGATYRRSLEFGRLDVVLSPEFTVCAIRSFFVFGGREPGRSAFSSPCPKARPRPNIRLPSGACPCRPNEPGRSR